MIPAHLALELVLASTMWHMFQKLPPAIESLFHPKWQGRFSPTTWQLSFRRLLFGEILGMKLLCHQEAVQNASVREDIKRDGRSKTNNTYNHNLDSTLHMPLSQRCSILGSISLFCSSDLLSSTRVVEAKTLRKSTPSNW